MGRIKKYQREELVQRAMEVFWRTGYNATNAQSLVETLGVNRFSLYAEFGNKQGLYEEALRHYERDVVSRNLCVLETSGAGLNAVAQFIFGFAAWAGQPGSEVGCFICNAATERGPQDEGVQATVARYTLRLSAAFTQCLNHARELGQLRTNINTSDEGRFLASLMLGVFVQLRAQVAPELIHASASAAVRHLQGLAVPELWTAPTCPY